MPEGNKVVSSRWPSFYTDTECRKFIEPEPDPGMFGILEITYKSDGSIEKVKMNKKNLVRFLRARRIVFDKETPFIFDGMIYRKATQGNISTLIYNVSEFLDGHPFLKKSDISDIYAMLKETTKSEDLYRQAPEGWNRNGYGADTIAFSNVLYSIELDNTVPFVPWFFIKHQLKAHFNPEVTEDPCEAVYQKILPDKQTRDFFFQAVGYSLFSRELSPPAIFVVYGPGETGKSALQKAITAAAGDENISTLDLNQISGNFTTAELDDKLINICGETGSGQSREFSKTDGELIKRLSDGQTITVQRKYGHPFQIKNTAKLWFISNTPPDFGDTSSGIYRRLKIIPCRIKQRWEDQIYDTLTTDTAVSWLINKAIEGYREFLDNGRTFKISEEMTDENTAYKTQDGLMDFLESYCGTLDKEAVCEKLDGQSIQEVYDQYNMYINESGGRPLSRRKMSEKIRNEFSLKNVKKRVNSENGNWTHKSYFNKIQMEPPKNPKPEPKPEKVEAKTEPDDNDDWTVEEWLAFREKYGLKNGMIIPHGADERLINIFKRTFKVIEKDGENHWYGDPE